MTGGLGGAPASAPQPKATAKSAPKPRPSQRPAKPRKSPSTRVRLNPVIEFFKSQRTRLALGVICSVLCITLLIVTINYLQSGPVDESLVASSSATEIVNSGQTVDNVGGPVGARLSYVLMAEGLGIGSFVSVFYLGVLALSLFGIMRCRFWAFTFKCLFTAVSLSIILGLFTYNAETALRWGGNHGRYINTLVMQYAGALGAFALTVVLIGLLVVMYLSQLRSFYLNVSGHVARARAAMGEAAAEARHPDNGIADVPDHTVAPAPKPETENQPAHIGFTIDDDEPAATIVNPVQVSPMPMTVETPAAPAVTSVETESNAAPASGPEFTINTAPGEVTDTTKTVTTVEQTPYSIRDELSHYKFPGLDLLIDRPVNTNADPQEQEENKNLIVKTLQDYGIAIARIEATIGPTVTLYEIVPAEGVRIAQIRRLEDDIARSLEALGIRIIAPIRGKGTVGIEVPNRHPQAVSMHSVIASRTFRENHMELPMALGKTINNEIFIADLAKMPHLLVAGATGQGKSVGLNCIIASLLYKKHPGELKFVLIDPKMVEFSLYARIERHYLAKLPEEEEPVITEPSKALSTLTALCKEMDNRYDLLKKAGVRNLSEYNEKFARRVLNPEKGHKFMPYIVIIVDEFADLIMMAGKEISTQIARIAQKARAVGMHMIIATQRPSTDVITGIIKANFPARIAFRVSSMIDSRTILDCPGANRLIGRGDMLFSHNAVLERVQCAFIDTPEVEALADFISRQTAYPEAYMLPEPENENALVPGAIDLSKRDELFDDCARFVVQNSSASTSSLQRRFAIGYNKAGKIMDQLEAAGIVGPADGQRPRAVLVDSVALESLLSSL